MKTPAKTEAKNFAGAGFPIFADFCVTAEKKARVLFSGLSNFRIIIVRFSLFLKWRSSTFFSFF